MMATHTDPFPFAHHPCSACTTFRRMRSCLPTTQPTATRRDHIALWSWRRPKVRGQCSGHPAVYPSRAAGAHQGRVEFVERARGRKLRVERRQQVLAAQTDIRVGDERAGDNVGALSDVGCHDVETERLAVESDGAAAAERVEQSGVPPVVARQDLVD